ncbi:MAG: DEAD/DEAH box helicase family protein [Desulfococcaceae bacterium]
MEARRTMNYCASILLRTPSLFAYKFNITYIWNAFGQCVTPSEIIERLKGLAKSPVPADLISYIKQLHNRYGKCMLHGDMYNPKANFHSEYKLGTCEQLSAWDDIVTLKSKYAKNKLPVLDTRTHPTPSESRSTPNYIEEVLRDYQVDSVSKFCLPPRPSGFLILPCGAGKTLIAITILLQVSCRALVLCTSKMSAKQWGNEFKKWVENSKAESCVEITEHPLFEKKVQYTTPTFKSKLTADQKLSAYITTYSKARELIHLSADHFDTVIFDEAHLAPSHLEKIPCIYAYTQRIGLTASLTRKDNYLLQLHNLVGPKQFELSWKELQAANAITVPQCLEVKVPVSDEIRNKIKKENQTEVKRIAATNPFKNDIVSDLLSKHESDQVLIFAGYNSQLDYLNKRYNIDVITGKTPFAIRERLLESFKEGTISRLGLSKIGSNALDLPNANIAIQLSAGNSSRQEEAQKVGRIMRPKSNNTNCIFYSLVSEDTVEEKISSDRQHFLIELGIPYTVIHYEDLYD